MITEINKILYATDLSKNSAYAFQYAADLADTYDAQIHLVHVIEKIPAYAMAIVQNYVTDEMKKNLDNRIVDTVEKIKNRVNIFCNQFQNENPNCAVKIASIDVYEGYPAEEILRKSQELDCDIIVMGTHGKGFLIQTFLGNVAEKVLRNSKKPVLVIPLPKDETKFTINDF